LASFFFFSSRRRHTRFSRDWSSDVCSSDLGPQGSARNEATINYEVDRTISHVKDAVGQLRRLSVAVVVNYREVDGEPQPLPEAEERKSVGQGKSADRG